MPAVLLRFLPHLLAVAGLICLGLWLRHSGHEAGERKVQAAWDAARVDEQAASINALEQTIHDAEAARAEAEATRAREGDSLRKDIAAIRSNLSAIHGQLDEDRNNDPKCDAWSSAAIDCPLRWLRERTPPGAAGDQGPGAGAVRPRDGIVPGADPAADPDPADQWRSAPVRGRIARAGRTGEPPAAVHP